MPGLTINGSTVAVTSVTENDVPRDDSPKVVRNFRGDLLSAMVTGSEAARAWGFSTPKMDATVAASFEADITTGDIFTVTGDLVGGATLTAIITDVQRTDEALWHSFDFTVEESL